MNRRWSATLAAIMLAATGSAVMAQVPRRGVRAATPGQRRQLIPWSLAVGKPEIERGHSVGFYVWHEGNNVFVATTSESDRGLSFSGQIRSRGGTITNPRGIKLEGKDRFRQNAPNVLGFRFDTHEAADGIKFVLNGGTRLALALRLQGSPTQHISVGPKAVETDQDPLVFDLSR